MGAIKWSRLKRVVIGAKEPKSGFSSYLDKPVSKNLDISFGLFEDRCSDLMKEFFRIRRS
jgi:tRNA(adenine34) deaminase